MNTVLRSCIPITLLALLLASAASCSKAPENEKSEQSSSSSNEQASSENDQSGQDSFTSPQNSKSSSMPSFNTATVEGKELTHKDLLGKVTVINYWGTWCPPCVEEIPHFQETYEKLNGQGFTILGIAIPQGGRGTIDDVKSFMKKHDMTYPVVMHESIPMDQFQQAYGRISGLPTTLVLDRSGKLQDSFIGYTSKEKLTKAVDPLMKE